jgi:hypothetical protein
VLTQSGAYMKDLDGIAKDMGKAWSKRPSNLV